MNVGSKDYLTIKELSNLIKKITIWEIVFNKKYPDGVRERKLDTSILDNLGWKAKINIKNGLEKYYDYFKEKYTWFS